AVNHPIVFRTHNRLLHCLTLQAQICHIVVHSLLRWVRRKSFIEVQRRGAQTTGEYCHPSAADVTKVPPSCAFASFWGGFRYDPNFCESNNVGSPWLSLPGARGSATLASSGYGRMRDSGVRTFCPVIMDFNCSALAGALP